MIKNLVKRGNSCAVIIDRPILDLVKLDPGSEVELTNDGTSIRISPVQRDDRASKIRNALEKVNAGSGSWRTNSTCCFRRSAMFWNRIRARLNCMVVVQVTGIVDCSNLRLLNHRQRFGGQYLHADVFEMAAGYLYHLVMNHTFVDGNK